MNKLTFLSVIALTLLIFSCDKIKNPVQKAPSISGCIDVTSQVVMTNTTISNFRKVLLEDYTGHRCPNCPRAAEIAADLHETYGNKLVVIANHVTNIFASPLTDTLFKEDFRNEASTAWSDQFGMSSLPTGLVNRKPATPQGRSVWATLVPLALNAPQSVKMDLTTYYDIKSKYLTIKVKSTFLSAWPNNVNLQIILTQDSIVSDQTDNAPPAGSTVDPDDGLRRLNYKHDHIVIGDVNGTWGELIKSAPINALDTASIQYNCFLVEKCFFKKESLPSVCLDDKNISVVAFIYDVSTNEILQVEKLKIR